MSEIISISFNYKINLIAIEVDSILPLFLPVEGFTMEDFYFFISIFQEGAGGTEEFLIVLRH